MSYIIILLVLALMLAPVFWIMPTAAQKRQTQMRERAMAMGFQVKITGLPQTHRDTVRKVDETVGVVYRLPWSNGRPLREPFHHLLVRNDDNPVKSTAGLELTRLLELTLASLPDYIVAVEYSNSGVAIYWREQGGLAGLEALYLQLIAIRDQFQLFQQQSQKQL